jgi:hypothetical protein
MTQLTHPIQLNLYNIHPRAFPQLMRHCKTLLPLRITHFSRLHNNTRERPCRTALGQSTWIDDQHGLHDL